MDAASSASRDRISAAQLVARVDSLPSFRAGIVRILQTIDDKKANAKKVAAAIEEDPPLTARILRIANSGFYARGGKVSDVRVATARLGLEELKRMVTAAMVAAIVPDSKARFPLSALYVHSVAAGLAVDALGRFLPGPPRSSAFTAGLLHHIGYFVLFAAAKASLERALERARDEAKPLAAVEEDELGVQAPEVAALLLQRWRLEPEIVEVARHQRQPESAPEAVRSLVERVRAADGMVAASQVAPGLDSAIVAPCLNATEQLGVVDNDIPDLLFAIDSAIDRARTLAGALGLNA